MEASGSWRQRLFPGDGRVWRAVGIVLAVLAIPLVIALLQPRDYFLGSNMTTPRVPVTQQASDTRMCVSRVRVPTGTGRVRFSIDSQTRGMPRLDLVLAPEGGTPIRGSRAASSATGLQLVDVPMSRPMSGPGDFQLARICLTPRDAGGPIFLWGYYQTGITEKPIIVGNKVVPQRPAIWYRDIKVDKKSIVAQLPQIMQRAALFRPGFAGAWTYWLLFVAIMPGLAYGGLRLLATAQLRRRRRVPLPVVVGLLTFGVCACWSFVTPTFQTPDESEHFGAAQYLAETGHANDATQGTRVPWSSDELVAIDAIRELSTFERRSGKAPWLKSYEEAYWARRGKGLPRNNGGGFHPATSIHSPLYYSTLAPAYLLVRHHSVFTQLVAMRWTSALMAATTAALTMLIILELLPGQAMLAVAGGLLVGFEPMFTFIGGGVNNDNGVNMMLAAVVYLLIRGLRRGLTPLLGVGLGAALVLGPLMKATGYAVYPSAVIAVVGMLWRRHERANLAGLGALLASFVAFYVGWDLLRVVFHRQAFTTPGGGTPGVGSPGLHHPKSFLVWLWQVLIPWKPSFMSDYTLVKWPFYNIYIQRGFGSFGWYAIEWPQWVTLVITAVMAIVGALALRTVWLFRAMARVLSWEIVVIALLPLAVFIGVESSYLPASIPIDGTAEQGRYIFTAITALAVIAIGGCFGLGRKRAVPIAAGLVAAMMVLVFAGQLLELSAFYS